MSSANNLTVECFTTESKSLANVKNKKKRGLKTVPRGTPEVTVAQSE